MDSILSKLAEVAMMTKCGGGTSGYFGKLRARGAKISVGGESSGPVHFMEMFDCVTNVVSQSSIRRGSFAAYIDVEHPDIEEFLQIRKDGHVIQHMSIGVCITDKWMQEMIDGDKDKRKIWAKIIQKRFESGYPYIFWTDTVNKSAPKVYHDKGLKIHASNLCSEICESTSPTESFVCCLSSINLLHWDEIKKTDAVEVLTMFLDAVMSEFITKAKEIPFMGAAYEFAKNQRAIGLGVLGWHSLLQSKSIAFESMEAKVLNSEIFRTIDQRTLYASQKMAQKYGEPDLLKGYGVRNVTRMAVAPTTSSAFILGQVSQSIEPLNSNYYVKDLAKGKYTYKNPYLKQVLARHGKDNRDVWEDILKHGGSVQHLDFLSPHEKDVFKTFGEISQKEIIIQAASRQKYIDQSQSLNLTISPEASPKEVSELMIEAWRLGVKTLYYQHGTNPSQALSRSLLECKSCSS
jgi:ribonucleoside-diphosphate reductase alpha chain